MRSRPRSPSEGIPSRAYFPPLHLQPYIRERFGTAPGMLPVTEDIAARTLALPFHNNLTESQVEIVVEGLRKSAQAPGSAVGRCENRPDVYRAAAGVTRLGSNERRVEDVSSQDRVERRGLEAGPGSIVAVHGANGSGKSTFLRLLAGVLSPTPGRSRLPAMRPARGARPRSRGRTDAALAALRGEEPRVLRPPGRRSRRRSSDS